MKARPNARLVSASVVVVLVAALLVSGAIVAGAHGGVVSRGVIHACVDDRTGDVEIVNRNAHCGPNASPLDWNAKGPEGNQGNQGPAGPPGPGLDDLTVARATGTTEAVVDCPGDSLATGGGGEAAAGSLTLSVPLEADGSIAESGDTPTGWFAHSTGGTVTVYAVCADADLDPEDDDDDDP